MKHAKTGHLLLFVVFLFSCATTNPRLNNLSHEDRLTYHSIEKIATGEELKQYLNLSPDQRKEWLGRFWGKLDPTPTTERNEFLEEHDRRVDYVLTNFHTIFGNRPWDERGDVYIIYGEPDERSLNIEASNKDYMINQTDFDEHGNRISKKDKFMREKMGLGMVLDTEKEFYKTCGELWTYDRYNLTFQFEDEDFVGYYALVPYTNSDGSTETGQELHIREAITVQMQKEIYHHDYGGEALDFALDLLKFRGEKGDYDIDLNLGLPLDDVECDDSNKVRFLRRISILDEELNQVKSDSIIVCQPIDENLGTGHLLVEQWQCSLSPGKYILAVEIRDLNGGKVGIYKKEFLLPAYVFPGTQEISNMVMASSIRKARRYETKYVKHGLVVLPMPTKVFQPDEMICFYYELYNLKKDEKGKVRYIVHYSLVDYKNRQAITLYEPETFEQDNWDVFQYARIDTYSLPPGEYALVIKVTDINQGKERITLTGFKIAGK